MALHLVNIFIIANKNTAIFAVFLMAMVVFGCLEKNSEEGESNQQESKQKPVVSQRSTGAFRPFASKDQVGEIKIYQPSEELILNTWKSRATLQRGTLPSQHYVHFSTIQGASSVQTPDLQVVSPLVEFKIRDLNQDSIDRSGLQKYVRIETVIDRQIEAKFTVVLLYLNYLTSNESRWTILPEELQFEEQEDGSKIVSFLMKDVDFAFSIAAARNGKATNGFLPFPAVPRESQDLTLDASGVQDEASQVKLSWNAVDGTRVGYFLQLAYEPIGTLGCKKGVQIENTQLTRVRQNFPKISKDSMLLERLVEGATVYLQLCSINSRNPPDISPGIDLVYDVPKRARAQLSNLPQLISSASTLEVTVGGEGISKYKHKIVKQSEGCPSSDTLEWTDVQFNISEELLEEANYLLCVWGSTNERNKQINPTVFSFTVDWTAPPEFSIDSIATPSYERSPTVSVHGGDPVLGVTNYIFSVAKNGDCTDFQYSQEVADPQIKIPTLPIGTYYMCVTTRDQSGNETTASNNGLAFQIQAFP